MLKATLIGTIGNDPEVHYAVDGSPFLRFNVAYPRRPGPRDDECQDPTEWVRVAVFGPRAEVLGRSLQKEMCVFVEGEIRARPWKDRDMRAGTDLEIVAGDVEVTSVCGGRLDLADDEPVRAGGECRGKRGMSEITAARACRPGRVSAANSADDPVGRPQ